MNVSPASLAGARFRIIQLAIPKIEVIVENQRDKRAIYDEHRIIAIEPLPKPGRFGCKPMASAVQHKRGIPPPQFNDEHPPAIASDSMPTRSHRACYRR